jgi:hypothetical protein
MKWRKTVVLWILLFVPLSLYNIYRSPIFFSTEPVQYVDPKVQHYNFSMASPISVSGNFSLSFPLERPQPYYQLSAYAATFVDYESYGAYGAFRLWASVLENGFHHSPNNEKFDFVLPPPVPPSGYGSALNGPLPGNGTEAFSHLIVGPNNILLNYTFFNIGVNSTTYTPYHYGPGYFKLNIGPFVVKVTDLVVFYSFQVVSELVLAAILFPSAHALLIVWTSLRRKK